MAKSRQAAFVPVEHITRSILVLRGQRVIIDSDLAAIYGVNTGRLNEAVKRNCERFPEDFVFRLSAAEHTALISQVATSKTGRGGAFVKLREFLASSKELAKRLDELESRLTEKLATHDQAIAGMAPAARHPALSSTHLPTVFLLSLLLLLPP